jgi:hypothetical protein
MDEDLNREEDDLRPRAAALRRLPGADQLAMKRIAPCRGEAPRGRAPMVRLGGGIQRSPIRQDLAADRADRGNRGDNDQTGDQRVFQHFAAVLIPKKARYVVHGCDIDEFSPSL